MGQGGLILSTWGPSECSPERPPHGVPGQWHYTVAAGVVAGSAHPPFAVALGQAWETGDSAAWWGEPEGAWSCRAQQRPHLRLGSKEGLPEEVTFGILRNELRAGGGPRQEARSLCPGEWLWHQLQVSEGPQRDELWIRQGAGAVGELPGSQGHFSLKNGFLHCKPAARDMLLSLARQPLGQALALRVGGWTG